MSVLRANGGSAQHPKTLIDVAAVWRIPETEGGAGALRIVDPGPAANHAPVTAGVRFDNFGFFVLVQTPLPHVAGQVPDMPS